MTSNKWLRQTHRWLNVAFTAVVIVNLVAVLTRRYTNSVGFLAVAPLLATGLYLFFLPYQQVAQRATRGLNGGLVTTEATAPLSRLWMWKGHVPRRLIRKGRPKI